MQTSAGNSPSPPWGFVAAGVLLPVLTRLGTHWLPLPYAAAVTNFAVFYLAFWLFSSTPPRTARGAVARLAIAATAGLAGLAAFWFPW